MEALIMLESQAERSHTRSQVTWTTESSLASVRKHHLVVVASAKIIVGIEASIDPNSTVLLQGRREEARVQRGAIYFLLFVA